MKPFKVEAKSVECGARLGKILTSRGEVSTPAFLPVGTHATVKTLSTEELDSLKIEMILANTYHLYLRPGMDTIKSAGGLHNFMNWQKPILTDSGGFQVFSLSDLVKLTDECVVFQSHIDGSYHEFTPEKAIETQLNLGSDVVLVLDECPAYPSEKAYIKKAVDRTLNWAKRSRKYFDDRVHNKKQQIFGIVQGGVFKDLRAESAKRTIDINFDGYAVGGLSVGEPKDLMYESTAFALEHLPADKARYAMGIGLVEDIWWFVENGVDLFDCVVPTRNARKGQIFTFKGKYNLDNARFKNDFAPLEENCNCYACSNYTRAYMHHLFKAKELLAPRMATLHNLCFMVKLMKLIRKSIKKSCFFEQKSKFLSDWNNCSI